MISSYCQVKCKHCECPDPQLKRHIYHPFNPRLRRISSFFNFLVCSNIFLMTIMTKNKILESYGEFFSFLSYKSGLTGNGKVFKKKLEKARKEFNKNYIMSGMYYLEVCKLDYHNLDEECVNLDHQFRQKLIFTNEEKIRKWYFESDRVMTYKDLQEFHRRYIEIQNNEDLKN